MQRVTTKLACGCRSSLERYFQRLWTIWQAPEQVRAWEQPAPYDDCHGTLLPSSHHPGSGMLVKPRRVPIEARLITSADDWQCNSVIEAFDEPTIRKWIDSDRSIVRWLVQCNNDSRIERCSGQTKNGTPFSRGGGFFDAFAKSCTLHRFKADSVLKARGPWSC
jgi:hypothetical protein